MAREAAGPILPYLEQMEAVHQRVTPLQAAAADLAYDFPLAHRELEKLEIKFFVRPQPAHDRTLVEFKRMRSHMTQRKMFTSAQTGMLCVQKACTAATAVCSGNTGQEGLRQLSLAGKMFECGG